MQQRKTSNDKVVVLPIPSDLQLTNNSVSSKSLALSDFTSINALSFIRKNKKSIGTSFGFTSNDRKKQRKHLKFLNEQHQEQSKHEEEPEPEAIGALRTIIAKI